MRTIKTLIAVMLVCFALSDIAFADVPLELIRTQQIDPEGTAGAVDGVEFSKDGVFYAASDNHGVARIYLTADGSIVGKVTHDYTPGDCAKSAAEINAIIFSHDGLYLATGDGGDDGMMVWKTDTYFDAADFAQNDTPYKHLVQGKEVDGADFSPNNQWLATASNEDLVIFNQSDFSTLTTIVTDPGAGAINSVDFSSDSQYVVFTGGGDSYIYIYETSSSSTWPFVTKFRSSSNKRASVKSVRFSPDNNFIVFGSRGQLCEVWRRMNDNNWSLWVKEESISHAGENTNPLPCDDTDSNAAVEAVEWSSNGAYLITGGLISGRLHLWNTSDWSEVGWIQAQENNRQIEFIDVYGNLVIVGGDEGGIRLYEFDDDVMLSSISSATTSISPIHVTVKFDQYKTGFEASDIVVTNATLENFDGSGTDYSFDLAPLVGGAVTATIPANATDQGNNASNTFSRNWLAPLSGVHKWSLY